MFRLRECIVCLDLRPLQRSLCCHPLLPFLLMKNSAISNSVGESGCLTKNNPENSGLPSISVSIQYLGFTLRQCLRNSENCLWLVRLRSSSVPRHTVPSHLGHRTNLRPATCFSVREDSYLSMMLLNAFLSVHLMCNPALSMMSTAPCRFSCT